MGAINTIANIELSEEEIVEVSILFDNSINMKNQQYLYMILYSCNKLKDKYPQFKNLLLKFAQFDDKNLKYHISRVLMFNKGDEAYSEWFKECLLSLSDTLHEEKGIINNLNYTFVNILEATNNYSVIKDFFLKWVQDSNITESFPQKSLEYFIHEFTSKYSILNNKFITEILNSENSDMHSIMSYLTVGTTKLDKELLSGYSDNDLLYICRKILGYFYEFNTLKNLVLSIQEKEYLTKNNKALIIEVFTNHIGKEYIHDTLDFFKKIDKKALNKDKKEIIENIIKNLEVFYDRRHDLPRLKELIPFSQESREIHKANQTLMSKSMEKAQEESILGQIGTKILIKYGKGSFSYGEEKYSEVSYLHKFSTSMTIPTTERAHPVDTSIHRYHFRIAKKGD